ncbi:hypothetical protein WJX74_003598 [Apatococcus lobatus]|uniref:DNA polymerase zeta catalytic subunit n=1 Tax=Apatococcus lobatus TaxID=904363 RepID=A0AAW1QCT8_9CHLO
MQRPHTTTKSSSPQLQNPPQIFSLRLVTIDHYLAKPDPANDVTYCQLAGGAIEQVPVVRIFGSTPAGQKVCLHLHKVFPYFFVPYDDDLPDEPTAAWAFMRSLAQSIEAAVYATQEPGTVRKQVVFSVQLVRARPFYGFHADERLFIKILLYDPQRISKVSSLLQAGSVMGRVFQAHESHVPYLLQFKIDCNLYGMGHVKLSHVAFRGAPPESAQLERKGWNPRPTIVQERTPGAHTASGSPSKTLSENQNPTTPGSNGSQPSTVWTTSTVPTQWLPAMQSNQARPMDKQSCCLLEVDASVEDILNRGELMRRPLEEAGQDVQMVESLGPMWDEEKLRIGHSPPTPPPGPERHPEPLCAYVEHIRAQFQDIADRQAAAAGSVQPSPAASQLPIGSQAYPQQSPSPIQPPVQHPLQTNSPSRFPPPQPISSPPSSSPPTRIPGMRPPMSSPFQTPHPLRMATHFPPLSTPHAAAAGFSPGNPSPAFGTPVHHNLIHMTQAANSTRASTSQQQQQQGSVVPLLGPQPPAHTDFVAPSKSTLAEATPGAAATPGLPRWMLPAATPQPHVTPSQAPGSRLVVPGSQPGSRPASQTRFSTQEADREMRELMAWMRQEREDEGVGGGEIDAEGNEEEADPDLLLALAEQAEQAASQRTPGLSPALKGQDVMQRVQSARASQSLRECDDILECIEDDRPHQRPNQLQASRLSRPGSSHDPLEDAISDTEDDVPTTHSRGGNAGVFAGEDEDFWEGVGTAMEAAMGIQPAANAAAGPTSMPPVRTPHPEQLQHGNHPPPASQGASAEESLPNVPHHACLSGPTHNAPVHTASGLSRGPPSPAAAAAAKIVSTGPSSQCISPDMDAQRAVTLAASTPRPRTNVSEHIQPAGSMQPLATDQDEAAPPQPMDVEGPAPAAADGSAASQDAAAVSAQSQPNAVQSQPAGGVDSKAYMGKSAAQGRIEGSSQQPQPARKDETVPQVDGAWDALNNEDLGQSVPQQAQQSPLSKPSHTGVIAAPCNSERMIVEKSLQQPVLTQMSSCHGAAAIIATQPRQQVACNIHHKTPAKCMSISSLATDQAGALLPKGLSRRRRKNASAFRKAALSGGSLGPFLPVISVQPHQALEHMSIPQLDGSHTSDMNSYDSSSIDSIATSGDSGPDAVTQPRPPGEPPPTPTHAHLPSSEQHGMDISQSQTPGKATRGKRRSVPGTEGVRERYGEVPMQISPGGKARPAPQRAASGEATKIGPARMQYQDARMSQGPTIRGGSGLMRVSGLRALRSKPAARRPSSISQPSADIQQASLPEPQPSSSIPISIPISQPTALQPKSSVRQPAPDSALPVSMQQGGDSRAQLAGPSGAPQQPLEGSRAAQYAIPGNSKHSATSGSQADCPTPCANGSMVEDEPRQKPTEMQAMSAPASSSEHVASPAHPEAVDDGAEPNAGAAEVGQSMENAQAGVILASKMANNKLVLADLAPVPEQAASSAHPEAVDHPAALTPGTSRELPPMPNAQARGGTEKERVGQGQVEPGPVSQRHGPLHAPTPVHVQPAVGHSQANPHRPVEPRSARRTREEVRRGDEATFSVRQALFGRARSSPTIHEEGRMVVGSEPAGFTHNEGTNQALRRLSWSEPQPGIKIPLPSPLTQQHQQQQPRPKAATPVASPRYQDDELLPANEQMGMLVGIPGCHADQVLPAAQQNASPERAAMISDSQTPPQNTPPEACGCPSGSPQPGLLSQGDEPRQMDPHEHASQPAGRLCVQNAPSPGNVISDSQPTPGHETDRSQAHAKDDTARVWASFGHPSGHPPGGQGEGAHSRLGLDEEGHITLTISDSPSASTPAGGSLLLASMGLSDPPAASLQPSEVAEASQEAPELPQRQQFARMAISNSQSQPTPASNVPSNQIAGGLSESLSGGRAASASALRTGLHDSSPQGHLQQAVKVPAVPQEAEQQKILENSMTATAKEPDPPASRPQVPASSPGEAPAAAESNLDAHATGQPGYASSDLNVPHAADYRAFEMKAAQTPWTDAAADSPGRHRDDLSRPVLASAECGEGNAPDRVQAQKPETHSRQHAEHQEQPQPANPITHSQTHAECPQVQQAADRQQAPGQLPHVQHAAESSHQELEESQHSEIHDDGKEQTSRGGEFQQKSDEWTPRSKDAGSGAALYIEEASRANDQMSHHETDAEGHCSEADGAEVHPGRDPLVQDAGKSEGQAGVQVSLNAPAPEPRHHENHNTPDRRATEVHLLDASSKPQAPRALQVCIGRSEHKDGPDIVREGVSGSEMSQLPLRAVPVAGDGSGRVDNAAAWVAGQRFRGQRGIWWRAKAPPPSQAEVEATLAEHGVPHVLHPPPFYGNPADVPERPPIIAGIQFRVPSSALGDLKPFGAATARGSMSAMDALQSSLARMGQRSFSTGRKWYVPAARPPTQAETDAWLEEESGHARPQQQDSRRHGVSPKSARQGSGFAMDANTGKLIPVGADLSQASAGGGGSDLLETPSMTARTSNHPQHHVDPPEAANPPEDEVRPASPKYDERTFFYTTPALHPPPSATKPKPTPFRPPPPVLPHTTTPSRLRPAHLMTAVSEHPPPETIQAPAEAAPPMRPASPKYDERSFFFTTPAPARSDGIPRPGNSGSTGRAPKHTHAPHDFATPAARPASSSGTALGKRPGPDAGRQPGLPAASTGRKRARFVSQITPPSPAVGGSGPTPLSQAGFKRLVPGKGHQLTLLSLEVHADCRGTLLPDPRYDATRCIIMSVFDDNEDVPDGRFATRLLQYDAAAPPGTTTASPLPGIQNEVHATEELLLDAFTEALRALDPDIIVGFEVQKGSLGYLADRAAALERTSLLREVSRVPELKSVKENQTDEYGQLHQSGLHSTGRIIINLWRALRSELKLNIYTFESCVAAVLQLRVPHIPAHELAQWFMGGASGGRWRCLAYMVQRAQLNLALLEQLDLVGRTAELARAFGIDFFSVLSRGSQYRVESLLVRLAHTQNYLMVSPSKEQVATQPAMEALPLVMEPESKFYPDPVAVLDFQSLYPSMIIAYNLCFSTCVGRPAHSDCSQPAPRLGITSFNLAPGTMQGVAHPDRLMVCPNGVAFLPHEARPGVVPRLLREILDTRIMVKGAMKAAGPADKLLLRVLNARQFGLKLIANVTYGYTAAGFSGRMPMAELADAIVQSGRQTLENAIAQVEARPEWNARVVYGDTDSMFVLLPGRSREEAHRIGDAIAAAVTAANPPPVTLKMEKVYLPCSLLSKKRYVGFAYESPSQGVPLFDAKGIETVRRDTCPAVAKIMERCLRILFATRDLSQVKAYLERQWSKILANRVSIQDFVFAKEVRLGTYSPKASVVPPAAIVAAKAMAQDPRAEPRFAERIPYVVVHGEPGARLVDMVVEPRALVESRGRLHLHAVYYITKQIIPALDRVFCLLGADLRSWFAAMPRPQRLLPQKRPPAALPIPAAPGIIVPGIRPTGASTIDRYYLSRHCAVCDGLTHAARPLCDACLAVPQLASGVLCARTSRLDRQHAQLVQVCLHCGGGGGRSINHGGVMCNSLDCGVYFERRKVAHELAAASALADSGVGLLS